MTNIKTLSEVVSQVKSSDVGKRDFTLPVQEIVVTSRTGRIEIMDSLGNLQHFNMNEHALGQLASRLGIPVNYARKCIEENPSLLAQHANHWINTEQFRDKQWFVRTQGEFARAFLTDKYSTLDNHYVVETLEGILGSSSEIDVKNLSIDPRYFNLRIIFKNLTSNIGTIQKPDNVMVGMHVSNSEVGSSSLRIDSCLFRLVCENGLISRVGGSSLLAQRHAHLTDDEMERRVANAITESVKVGDGAVEKFAKLREIKVADPLEEIKRLAQQEKYSNNFIDDLTMSYAIEKEFTRDDSAFTLVNAFTRSAQNKQAFDQRLEVETFAGRLMENYLK